MIQLEVHYMVKADKVEFILDVIKAFVAGIRQNEPKTSYIAYQSAEDPTQFVHFMSFPDEAAQKYHQQAPHTMEFVEKLYPECAEKPVFTALTAVASTK